MKRLNRYARLDFVQSYGVGLATKCNADIGALAEIVSIEKRKGKIQNTHITTKGLDTFNSPMDDLEM